MIPVILGLVASQVIATYHVYLSNASLYRTTALIRDAGYLVVPNAHIMPSLKEWGPAFFAKQNLSWFSFWRSGWHAWSL